MLSEFVTSQVKIELCPDDGLPEMVLIGKSNVGKSSFINAYCGRKNLARISGEPGKTRTVNFYRIDSSYYLVDLPGYGYARASKTERAAFSSIIRSYLERREADFAVFFLADIRHPASALDREVYRFVCEAAASPAVILTKSDKLSRSARLPAARKVLESLGAPDPDDEGVFILSSVTGEGMEEVRGFARGLITRLL